MIYLAFNTTYFILSAFYYAICFSSIAFSYSLLKLVLVIVTSSINTLNVDSLSFKAALTSDDTYSLWESKERASYYAIIVFDTSLIIGAINFSLYFIPKFSVISANLSGLGLYNTLIEKFTFYRSLFDVSAVSSMNLVLVS